MGDTFLDMVSGHKQTEDHPGSHDKPSRRGFTKVLMWLAAGIAWGVFSLLAANAVMDRITTDRFSKIESRRLQPGDIAERRYYEEDTNYYALWTGGTTAAFMAVGDGLLTAWVLGGLPSRESRSSRVGAVLRYSFMLGLIFSIPMVWIMFVGWRGQPSMLIAFLLGVASLPAMFGFPFGLIFYGIGCLFKPAGKANSPSRISAVD